MDWSDHQAAVGMQRGRCAPAHNHSRQIFRARTAATVTQVIVRFAAGLKPGLLSLEGLRPVQSTGTPACRPMRR